MKKNYGIVIAICLLSLYVIIRSYTVDITNDEAYSFHNVKYFWYAESFCTANTHWLNSAAIKAALLLGLENNWAIRWFSALSAIIFFIICYFFIRSLTTTYHQLFACTLLLFNPFVLDYFGLARGYASGIMLESTALFLFIIAVKKQKRFFAFLAVLCAGLSAIGNYSFVYFFAAFSIVYFSVFYFKKGFSLFKNIGFYIDLLVCFAISAFVIRAWMFLLKCSQDLGAGTDSIDEVCTSFIDGLVYFRFHYTETAATIITCILIGLVVIICGYGIFKFKKHKQEIYFYSSLILSITLLILAVNFLCFKIVLPYARTILFLFPLVCICVIYFVQEAFHFQGKNVALIALSILFLLPFLRKPTFSYTLDFAPQEDTRNVFNYCDSIGATNIGMSMELYGVYINYYQITEKLKYHFKAESLQYSTTLENFKYLLLAPPWDLTKFNTQELQLSPIKKFSKNHILLLEVYKK
ncbi:MAG TPA: glycosyltransferase family 39 protein [Bacteroidia bacterium]|jgi:hypothetical protein|nr:glycosyltransferase family 39 protein [Bacteroidia bacterium]